MASSKAEIAHEKAISENMEAANALDYTIHHVKGWYSWQVVASSMYHLIFSWEDLG